MAKINFASQGVGNSDEAVLARRVARLRNSIKKVERELQPADTYDAEQKLARLAADLKEVEDAIAYSADPTKYREMESKLVLKNWLRDVRLALNGSKNKTADQSIAYKIFEYIYKAWSRAGKPETGCEIAMARIAKTLDKSEAYIGEIIHDKLREFVEVSPARGRRPSAYRPKAPPVFAGSSDPRV